MDIIKMRVFFQLVVKQDRGPEDIDHSLRECVSSAPRAVQELQRADCSRVRVSKPIFAEGSSVAKELDKIDSRNEFDNGNC